MTERLRTTIMLTAILLACAVVTAMLWLALRIATEGDTMTQRSLTITVPGPPVHAQLMPALMPGAQLMPYLLPAHPAKHRR
jgi:hypothetical protein